MSNQENVEKIIREGCVNLKECLTYIEMTLDPESEVLRCHDCPAYELAV